MRKIQSDCLFPIYSNPIPNGILLVSDDDTIVDIIDPATIDHNISDIQYFNGIICPGFVNTHCHLELSFLKNKIDKNIGLHNFVIEVQRHRFSDTDVILQSISDKDSLMYAQGIVAVADTLNTTDTLKCKSQSKIFYHNFIELIGSDPEYADIVFRKGIKILEEFELKVPQNKSSLTPHSLYASSERLLKTITEHAKKRGDLISFHHLEGQEEKDFFFNKSGTIPERLKYFNVDISSFRASGKSPLETYYKYLPEILPLLLVHNIYAHQDDIEFALEKLKNVWWCLCPNSNLYIENKLPDVNLMLKNNCRLTIGTDSLASNDELNILSELYTLQKQFNINTNDLLKMATLNGAEYLRIDNTFGSFTKNKTPGIVLIKNANPGNYYLTDKSESERITL